MQFWYSIEKHSGFKRIISYIKAVVHNWIINHPRVFHPKKITFSILLLVVKKKIYLFQSYYCKLLSEIPIKVCYVLFHQVDHQKHVKNNNIVIIYSVIFYILPPKLRNMHLHQKVMCECWDCTYENIIHAYLIAWWKRYFKLFDLNYSGPTRLKSVENSRKIFSQYKDKVIIDGKIFMRVQYMLHMTPCDYLILRIRIYLIGCVLFVVDWTFLLQIWHMKRLKNIMISQALDITYTRNLAVVQSTVK